MTRSYVAHQKVKENTKEAVFNAVQTAMRNAEWKKFVTGKNIFLKINLLSHQVVPGHCTSPWVLEAVLQELQQLDAKIFVGDANVATVNQVEKAAKAWRVLELCKQYNAEFVNLSHHPTIKQSFNGVVFKHSYLPEPLVKADSIVSIPVLKTHSLCTMTCALKNQWGCLPKFRHNYHDRIHQAIAEINSAVKVNFVIADATVCSEGNGPRNGTPKIVNSVLASSDRVSLDTAAAHIIGVDHSQIKYISEAEKIGIGTINYKLIGDEIVSANFKLPDLNKMPIIKWEMRLRHTPLLKTLLFKTPIFSIFAWLATEYNTVWWHNTTGKKTTDQFLLESKLYSEEFRPLLK